ncbi:hypothetical protein [Pontibacter sp. G13]|uniref:hypothetical protein n=1 Tax=Pontibacter sp. G13 TaxID=3074898 RepID=UPI00288B9A0A|nr:hypothetical protein [Pontibacter sp. G13]WNJ19175.1 hypothetical protein RJD25_01675 [Pontibacter sp. G13]
MKSLYLVILVAWTVGFSPLFGQHHLPTRPIQISFFYPLGTSGFHAGQYAHAMSFNAIAGYHGGVRGMEFGGVANVVRHDVYGMQFAGVVNVVGDGVTGIQMAGVLNAVGNSSNGIQMAGVANVQRGRFRGMQMSGVANLNFGDVDGIQMAGVVNVARRVRGLQLGLFNYAKSVDRGASIGLISWVEEGYRRWEIGTSESFRGMLAFKMGTERFYNILAIATTWREGEYAWAPGYGIGTLIPLKRRWKAHVEAIAYSVQEGSRWSEHILMLNRLNGGLTLCFDGWELYGGGSVNVLIDDLLNGSSALIQPNPEQFFLDELHRRTQVTVYPGFTAGIRI